MIRIVSSSLSSNAFHFGRRSIVERSWRRAYRANKVLSVGQGIFGMSFTYFDEHSGRPSRSVPFLLQESIQSHRSFDFGILEPTHLSKDYMIRYTRSTIFFPRTIIYADQPSRRIALPLNRWKGRFSDLPLLPIAPTDQGRKLALEGWHSVFIDERSFFLIPKDGTVYLVEIVVDGKAVSRLAMAPSLAQMVVPSLSINIWGNHVLAFRCAGPSVLLKAAHVEMEVGKIDVALTVVVQDDNQMDYDDEDEGLCLFFGYCGPYWLKYVFRYLWNFQNHSDEEWVNHQWNTTYCQENENQVCNSPFVTRFFAYLWANCQHDIFVGEQWCKFLFNLHHCGYSILTNRLNSS